MFSTSAKRTIEERPYARLGHSSLKREFFTIIYLTKVHNWWDTLDMEVSVHGFFGLAADALACNDRRRSLLMLANNRRVGIFFNVSRFSTACFGFSMRNPL